MCAFQATIPKIFIPVNENTLIFLFGLIVYKFTGQSLPDECSDQPVLSNYHLINDNYAPNPEQIIKWYSECAKYQKFLGGGPPNPPFQEGAIPL